MESTTSDGFGIMAPRATRSVKPSNATMQTKLGGAGQRLLASRLPLPNHGVRTKGELVVNVIVRYTSCGNVFASSSPTVPLPVIERLLTLAALCDLLETHAASRLGEQKKHVSSRSGAAKWVKSSMDISESLKLFRPWFRYSKTPRVLLA